MASRLVVVRTDPVGKPVDPANAPTDVTSVASFLKSPQSKLKNRQSALNGGIRVEYFKGLPVHLSGGSDCFIVGKKAIAALLREEYDNPKRPPVDDAAGASELLRKMMESHNFFYRIEKGTGDERGTVSICPDQTFAEDGYYVWQWESKWTRLKATLYSYLLLALVFVSVLFPLWPVQLRIGVWYLSMAAVGLIGGLLAIAVVRLILFVLTMILPPTKPGIWLFPNLFADVGVIDSFIPAWGWHGIDYEAMHLQKYRRGGKKKKKRSKKTETDGDDSIAEDIIADRSQESDQSDDDIKPKKK